MAKDRYTQLKPPKKVGYVIQHNPVEEVREVKRMSPTRGGVPKRARRMSLTGVNGQDYYQPDEYEMEGWLPDDPNVNFFREGPDHYSLEGTRFRFFKGQNGEVFARTDEADIPIDEFVEEKYGERLHSARKLGQSSGIDEEDCLIESDEDLEEGPIGNIHNYK